MTVRILTPSWADLRPKRLGSGAMAVTERTLPEGPNRMFKLAEPVLSRHFDPSAYALGGGTALAAVWRHRHSTDVDLFMDSAAYRAVSMNDGLRASLENDLRDALRPMRLDVMRGFIKVLAPDGELSLSTSDPPIEVERPFPHRVAGSMVAIEPPELVITRKIQGRMMGNGVFVVRDMYDIAAASVLDRGALVAALDAITDEERDALRNELARLPQGWAGHPSSGRPILNAARPKSLAGNAERCLHVAKAVLAGDWSPADALRAHAVAGARGCKPESGGRNGP
ncbi:MAG: nucleotidyl transferase AbiEii/AbiGii toxin family protein [Gammaproteobacteria bacterium]|nr:nucleotidyl transferase AbiEii/AbiGii toxin family protein [Gammaproteobacteria bacterium]